MTARTLDKAIEQYAFEQGQRSKPAKIPVSWTRSQRGSYKSWLSRLRSGYQPTQRETKKRWTKKFVSQDLYLDMRPHIQIGKAHYSLIMGRDIKDLVGMVLKFSYDQMEKYNAVNPDYFGSNISKRYFQDFLKRLNRIYDAHGLGDSPKSWNRDLSRFRKIKVRVFYAV